MSMMNVPKSPTIVNRYTSTCKSFKLKYVWIFAHLMISFCDSGHVHFGGSFLLLCIVWTYSDVTLYYCYTMYTIIHNVYIIRNFFAPIDTAVFVDTAIHSYYGYTLYECLSLITIPSHNVKQIIHCQLSTVLKSYS